MAKKSLTPDEKMCANLTDKLADDFANGGEKRGFVNTFEILKEYCEGDRKQMKQAEKFMDTPSDEIIGYFDGLISDDKVVPLYPAGAMGVIGKEGGKGSKFVSASRFDTPTSVVGGLPKRGPSIIAVKVWGPSGISDFAFFSDEHRGNGWNPIVFKTVRTDRKESLIKQYDNQLTADSWPRP